MKIHVCDKCDNRITSYHVIRYYIENTKAIHESFRKELCKSCFNDVMENIET